MKNILIIGAGIAGKDVLREIKNNPDLGFKVHGFVDDNLSKKSDIILGVKILGNKKDLASLIKKYHIDEVIIAIPSALGEEINEYVNICSKSKVSFRIVPRVREIIEGKAHVESVRRVQVEDLLGRPVVKTDVNPIKKFLNGKVVLITGAAGSIGSELSRQIAAYNPKKIIFFDWWENGLFNLQAEIGVLFPHICAEYVIGNIQDLEKVKFVLMANKPDLVFHAAAYKHVPLMENNPEEAIKNNIFGTYNVANESKKVGVSKFVFVSTDKAADPVNIMGATKLIAESIVKKLNGDKTKFIIVRFGNVLDSYGSVIPTFRKQIENGGPVTVTDKRMTRFFMTIPEASQLILKSSLLGNGGELFVLDMGKQVKIIDLAKKIIRLSGHVPDKDIKIVFTGVRKGEKLKEKLVGSKDKLIKTKFKKIFVSTNYGLNVSEEKLDLLLSELKDSIYKENKHLIQKIFKNIVTSLNN